MNTILLIVLAVPHPLAPRNIMRIRLGCIVAVAALTFVPSMVEAQSTIGPTLAYHDDADLGLGVTLRAPLSGFGDGVGIMGDFLLFFPDAADVDYLEFNGNVTYDFPLEDSAILPFVLAGLNISRSSTPGGSNTDLGLNLGGGLEFDLGRFRPVAGGRIELGGGEAFVLFLTLPFQLGS